MPHTLWNLIFIEHSQQQQQKIQEKSYYSDSGDMDYSNNGFETSGMLNASSNSISIDLSPGNTVSRDHNSGETYGYVCKNASYGKPCLRHHGHVIH